MIQMKTTIKKSTKSSRAKTASGQALLRSPKRRTAPSDLVPPLMKISSILVPVDFSPESEKVLAYAVPFARQFGAKLTVLHVVEPTATPDFLSSFPLVIENDKLMAESKGHLDRIVSDLAID